MTLAPIIQRLPDGTLLRWVPTTLEENGMREQLLEQIVAENPEVLELHRFNIGMRAVRFTRQVTLPTPEGRHIRPDLLGLTDRGDLLVIEAKRFGNSDLEGFGGRSVIAQTLDYVIALSSISERELALKLSKQHQASSFEELVRETFPGDPHPDSTAATIRSRRESGEIILIILCDKAPNGTAERVRLLSNQQTLAFELRIIEVTPFVCAMAPGQTLFQAHISVRTEIVSRTAVIIRNEVGGDRVVVQVAVEEAPGSSPNDEATFDGRPRATTLYLTARSVGLTDEELWDELTQTNIAALDADWSAAYDALAWPWIERRPYLRGKRILGYRDGRLGIDLISGWKAGIFVGVLVNGTDHRTQPSQPTKGVDFCVILDTSVQVGQTGISGADYCAQPEFQQLRKRLAVESGGWSFLDHLAVPKPNLWHPIHLRRPLSEVFAGAKSPEERRSCWLDAGRSGIAVLLAGGELQALRERWSATHQLPVE